MGKSRHQRETSRRITYKGVSNPIVKREPIPVTEGLRACPMCGGGVKPVGAIFTDHSVGITKGSRVFSKHAPGGHRVSKYGEICSGSGRSILWRKGDAI